MKSISQRIAEELGVREQQVEAAISLLDGGATVPFIARYRKEATGTLTTRNCGRWRSGCDTCASWKIAARRSSGASASRASSTMRSGRRSRPRTARRGSRTSIEAADQGADRP
jgi:hypothetical protein